MLEILDEEGNIVGKINQCSVSCITAEKGFRYKVLAHGIHFSFHPLYVKIYNNMPFWVKLYHSKPRPSEWNKNTVVFYSLCDKALFEIECKSYEKALQLREEHETRLENLLKR